VVGVIVNHDLVAIPKPVIAIGKVEGSHGEVGIVEPEPLAASAGKMPNVIFADASSEPAVFPWVIEVVPRIVTARIMADPFAVRMNVRRVGMPRFVDKVMLFLGMLLWVALRLVSRRGPVNLLLRMRWRPVRGYVTPAHVVASAVLLWLTTLALRKGGSERHRYNY
jgi:hypothetical protein